MLSTEHSKWQLNSGLSRHITYETKSRKKFLSAMQSDDHDTSVTL